MQQRRDLNLRAPSKSMDHCESNPHRHMYSEVALVAGWPPTTPSLVEPRPGTPSPRPLLRAQPSPPPSPHARRPQLAACARGIASPNKLPPRPGPPVLTASVRTARRRLLQISLPGARSRLTHHHRPASPKPLDRSS